MKTAEHAQDAEFQTITKTCHPERSEGSAVHDFFRAKMFAPPWKSGPLGPRSRIKMTRALAPLSFHPEHSEGPAAAA